MAAGALKPYTEFIHQLARQNWDFLSGVIKMALLDADYNADSDAHETFNDVIANEISDGDYAQQTLASKTITRKEGLIVFDAANVSFGTNVTIAAKFAIIYVDTAGSDYLMGYIDLDTSGSVNVSSTNSDFAVNFDTFGMYGIDPIGTGVSSGL